MRRILLLFIALPFLGCGDEKSGSRDITQYIPQNAAVILKLNNPDLFFSNLGDNEFFANNASHPLPESLRNKLSFFGNFSHKEPSLLIFSAKNTSEISFTYISRGIPEIKNIDSLRNKKVETIKKGSLEITRYSLENGTTFTTQRDSIFLVSDSQEVLENSLESAGTAVLPNYPDFEKALKAASDKNPTIFINHRNLPDVFLKLLPGAQLSDFPVFSNWTVLDTEITRTSLKLNGITTAGDSLPKFINLFKGVDPAENELASITPGNSNGFVSFTFRDFTTLKKNLDSFNNDTPGTAPSEEELLLQQATETGMIYFEEGNVFAVKAPFNDPSEAFYTNEEPSEEFRGIPIYPYKDSGEFKKLLTPLVSPQNLNFALYFEPFVLFSEKAGTLKEVLTQFQNKNTFGNNETYLSFLQSLSTEASALWVSKNSNVRELLSERTSEEYRSATQNISIENFPFTALQFIYNGNFAHVHGVLEKSDSQAGTTGVHQSLSVDLDTDLASPPAFIENHRTKGMDIAVQDMDNTLYLISEGGKIYWKKKLDSRILGKIQQVDLYRNGRIQLAFATQGQVQVIDRNGNEVKPFPLDFKDEITQPLAIFDYDNNRNYRFVVVQENEVYMYDNKARRVNGFNFSKAKDAIIQPPVHIRLGNKDYILIAEASGKLNILNRRGQIRVPLKEQINFSRNAWYGHNDQFVSTNTQGDLVKVDQKGNIDTEPAGLQENHRIDATAKTLVTLSENNLSINDKTVELDFGLYTRPSIFYLNNKIYVSVTDTQAQRVFLFDSNAKLLPDFPVYGTSVIDLGNIDGDKNFEFVVEGEQNSLLLYQMKE